MPNPRPKVLECQSDGRKVKLGGDGDIGHPLSDWARSGV